MSKQAVTYVRVSSREQFDQGFSPEAQRVSLYDFARRNGFVIVKEFEDVETAKAAGRKSFQAMLEYVKKEGIKYILVEKTDRLHRNFQDYVLIEELTEKYDVTLFLVKENNSIGRESKSGEKLMYGMRTLLAKNFIDNLREEVHKGVNIKIQHGEYPGLAPLGYKNIKDPYNSKHNVIGVDPLNRELMVKMFEYYATGRYSIQSLIERLQKEGLAANIPTKSGKLFVSCVAKYLVNPFYIGKFLWKGKVHQGIHEPIVRLEVWQQVQTVLSHRSGHSTKEHNVRPFVYRGIFSCGACKYTFTPEFKKGQYRYYHCTHYAKCGQPWVTEEEIDSAAYTMLNVLKLGDTGFRYVTAALKKSFEEKRAWSTKAFDALVNEQSMLRKRMEVMYEDRLDGKITTDFYEKKTAQYSERIGEIETQLSKQTKDDVSYYDFGVRIIELAENADILMNNATPEEKMELMRYLLSNSTIKDKKPEFALNTVYKAIQKHAPVGTRSGWQGWSESNRQSSLWRRVVYR